MAVVSALAIGGGYVAWRNEQSKKAQQSELIKAEPAGEKPELLLSGSKSLTGGTLLKEGDLTQGDFTVPIPGIPEGSEKVTNVIPLMPGSKSAALEILPENLLPSSKIGIIRLREKEVEPHEQKDPALLPGSKSGGIFIPKKAEPEKSE